jgi:hypothetical protein
MLMDFLGGPFGGLIDERPNCETPKGQNGRHRDRGLDGIPSLCSHKLLCVERSQLLGRFAFRKELVELVLGHAKRSRIPALEGLLEPRRRRWRDRLENNVASLSERRLDVRRSVRRRDHQSPRSGTVLPWLGNFNAQAFVAPRHGHVLSRTSLEIDDPLCVLFEGLFDTLEAHPVVQDFLVYLRNVRRAFCVPAIGFFVGGLCFYEERPDTFPDTLEGLGRRRRRKRRTIGGHRNLK